MHFFILLILACPAFSSEIMEHKRGFLFGIGGSGSRFTYPAEYEGADKTKLDDKATIFAGTLQLGLDTVLFDRLLLGIRTEGLTGDTMGTGNKSANKLNGRMHSASATARAGILFQVKTFDPVGDPAPFILEVFSEAGMTAGERHFSKSFSSGGDEYVDNMDENYRGNVLSLGLNLTTVRGAFLEVRGTSTMITDTRRVFTGRKTENGGGSVSIDRKDDDKKSFTTFHLIVGHHF